MEEPSHDPSADAPETLFASTHPDHASAPGSTWKRGAGARSAVPPAVRYEHFEILRHEDGSLWQLGSGAMGTTFKALDMRLHHHVALKVVSADLTGFPAARERFLREARTAARLHHPNVARIFHLGETGSDSAAFYAMEYVEGETLEARVRRSGPLSVWLTLEVGIEVARALVAACQQDLIHRDLKPTNLMLVASVEAATVASVGADSSHGEASEAWVKVIDFGLAKAMVGAGPLTGVGDFVGTPAYASPEQFTGGVREVDGRSDIYSLGGTLWYALTGRMPFEGNTITAIERQKFSDAPRAAQLAVGGVPPALSHLIAAMLSADAGDRPQTPSILLEALRRCRAELRRSAPVEAGETRAHSFFFAPLRRFRHRRIYQVFLGYAVGAWLLLQIVAIVLPNLEWPRWIMRALIVTLLAGFGEALLLGWALDRRAAGKALLPQRATRRLGFVLLALAPAALLTVFFLWRAVPELAAPVSADAPAIPAKSVAVLPFENLSADPDNAFFADGVQDEILTDLSKIADLRVISRTSVMSYRDAGRRDLREIGRLLGVAHLLEGSVQRVGRTVRVNAQLIDARTSAHLWAEHYDRPLDDVFSIQSDIAEAIARQLRARLSPQERNAIDAPPTRDLAAYDLYLRARAQQQAFFKVFEDVRRNAQGQVPLLEQAVARDPDFALAYCELARAHDQLHYTRSVAAPAELSIDHRSLAEAALAKARRLQPDAGEVHLAQATHFLYTRGDPEQSRIEADLAMRALPGNARAKYVAGRIAQRQGRWDEAVRLQTEAAVLEPRDANLLDNLARTYRYLRRYEEADRTLAALAAVVPARDGIDVRLTRAVVGLEGRADLAPLQSVLADLPADLDEADREDVEMNRLVWAVCARNPTALMDLLAHTGHRDGFLVYGVRYPLAYYRALAARMRGDHAGARRALTDARQEVEKLLLTDAADAAELGLLAVIDAQLGRGDDALREARQACGMASSGGASDKTVIAASNLVAVYAWTNQSNAALDELEHWLGRPTGDGIPFRFSYGDLRFNPFYEPLRSNPRFEALITRFARSRPN